VWLLIAIESTMFALLASSYFYLRGNESEWPPTGAANAPIAISAITIVWLLMSCIPNYYAFFNAPRARLRAVQRGMLGVTIASFAAAIARGFELASIGFKWNSHAYGSIVWALYFMHTLHVLSGAFENLTLTALLYRGPVEKKLMVDVRLSTIYWAFVVVAWIPFWLLLYLDERVLR